MEKEGFAPEQQVATQQAMIAQQDPHLFTVVVAGLKAVGAPTAVALIDGDASVMAPLDAAGVALEQEAVDLSSPGKPACHWAAFKPAASAWP